MSKHILFGGLLGLAAAASAQTAQYSYISDRKFAGPEELVGYDFKPALRQVATEQPQEIAIGQYSFGITRKNLYVEGPEIKGVYSLNNINTTEYGYKLLTMNARDPTVQGHLKVVIDDLAQVEGLIFKRSNNDEEVMYFLRIIEPEVAAVEEAYFTDKGEARVEHIDSLWTGTIIRPFLRVFYAQGGVQQRAVPSDSLSLQFYSVTTITEEPKKEIRVEPKELKKARKARKKLEKLAAATGDSTLLEDIEPEAVFVGAKTKVTVLTTKTSLALNQDSVTQTPANDEILDTGFETAPATALPLAGATGPDPVASADSLAAPAIDSSEWKIRVVTKYFIDLNQYVKSDDGTSGMQNRTYLVNGIVERENTNAGPGGNRFQWELNIDKQPNSYVYLDELYNVISIAIDGQKFYMRGQ